MAIKVKTFLFQGDSITDACRGREDVWNLGYGYPDIFAAKVSFRHPGAFRIEPFRQRPHVQPRPADDYRHRRARARRGARAGGRGRR